MSQELVVNNFLSMMNMVIVLFLKVKENQVYFIANCLYKRKLIRQYHGK